MDSQITSDLRDGNQALRVCKRRLVASIFLIALSVTLVQDKLQAQVTCEATESVCVWKQRIVGIRTPTMIASAVLLNERTLITNKHVAEDHPVVKVRFQSGFVSEAEVIPNDHPADLAVFELTNFDKINLRQIDLRENQAQNVRVVAFDQGRNGPRVYPESTYAIYPDSTSYPQARIHSDLFALPGNSGGAVVDKNGELVGILASGDGNINEIIPAVLIDAVLESSTESKRKEFLTRGEAIRNCADLLYESNQIAKDPPAELVKTLKKNCLSARNKQLFDQAGQLFGKWWMFRLSEMFLNESLKLDPQSPNTLMSLAVSYHLNRDYVKEKPILKKYLDLNPTDPQAMRLAVQVAGALKDRDLADRALELMRLYNPNAVEFAEEFLDSSFEN